MRLDPRRYENWLKTSGIGQKKCVFYRLLCQKVILWETKPSDFSDTPARRFLGKSHFCNSSYTPKTSKIVAINFFIIKNALFDKYTQIPCLFLSRIYEKCVF